MSSESMTETSPDVNQDANPDTAAIAATATSPAGAAKKLPPPNADDVRESLQKVIDPELHMNIVELGLIYKISVNDEPKPDIDVEMTLTSPGCPYGPVIMGQVPSVLKQDYADEIGEVTVNLTFSPPWDPATMASEDVQFELGIF